MKLAFYKGRAPGNSGNGTFFDRAICWWTRSPYAHVELVFDEPREALAAIAKAGKPIQNREGTAGSLCFSSSPRDGGVRFKFIDINPDQWDVVDVMRLTYLDSRAAARASDLCGLKYDWLGIFGFVFPFKEHGDDDRFCSEVCAELLQGLGLLQGHEPWSISPGALYDMVTTDKELDDVA